MQYYEYYNTVYIVHVGTGKSITGTHLAYIFSRFNRERAKTKRGKKEMLPHQCVVYCAPSNKAVDVVQCCNCTL